MIRSLAKFATALAIPLATLLPLAPQAQAQQTPTISLGYAKCAHCTALELTPEYEKDVKINALPFTTANDVLTALLSKSIDIAQVTYLHYVTALDRGFEVVAISGQVNGGSQLVVGNTVAVQPNDWAGLKKLIAQYKADGKPFRVAASRGNAQDIQMRGDFLVHGIDVNKDVQFINIPNPADDVAALRRGEVELVSAVEPFATQVVQLKAAKFFAYPYDQAAGNLTNLIITRPDVITSNRAGVLETVRAIVASDNAIAKDKPLFVNTIVKITGLDKQIAEGAVGNLVPDYKMYLPQTLAIAKMMHDLHYINSDVTDKAKANMDYSFLEKVTGKPKSDLGY